MLPAAMPVALHCTAQNMYKILGEDKVMLEQLKPEQIKTELSLEADKPQVAFRKLRQVRGSRGMCNRLQRNCNGKQADGCVVTHKSYVHCACTGFAEQRYHIICMNAKPLLRAKPCKFPSWSSCMLALLLLTASRRCCLLCCRLVVCVQEWIDMGYAAPPETVTSHEGSLSADL